MQTVYEYQGKIYLNEDEVDEAIEEAFASNYNNRPVPDHVFEYEWAYNVDIQYI